MLKQQGTTVYQRPDGSWAIKQGSEIRPSSVHASLLEAERQATALLASTGGGVLITTMGWSHPIRVKRTVTG